MAEAGLDALILGREANARYVSGARRLWLAGARPFAPGCVLVASGDVHLLSGSDEGIPPDIPFSNLYALTWNPANLMARLAAIPELASARTIGVDALTPNMESLLAATFPHAELRDGQSVLSSARRQKLPEEVEAMRQAISIATRALDDVIVATEPGVTEKDLRAQFALRMCELGTATPAFEGTFGGVFPSDRALRAGDRVVLDVGVLVDGYEGGLARTIVCGDTPAAPSPADEQLATLLRSLRSSSTGGGLRDVFSVGLGLEAPIGAEDVLESGMTLSVRVEVDGWVSRTIVVITDEGAQPLDG